MSEDSRLAFTHRNPPEMAQHLCNPACKDLPEDNYPWRVHVNQRTGERRAER